GRCGWITSFLRSLYIFVTYCAWLCVVWWLWLMARVWSCHVNRSGNTPPVKDTGNNNYSARIYKTKYSLGLFIGALLGFWDSNPSCVGWSCWSHQASKLIEPVIMAVVVGCIGGVGCCVRAV